MAELSVVGIMPDINEVGNKTGISKATDTGG